MFPRPSGKYFVWIAFTVYPGHVANCSFSIDSLLSDQALYVKMGTFNIISTGLLTLFFKGLLELSKSFLDPFGREGYRAHNIRVDVLVSEMNFGASSRWVEAGDALPSAMLAEIGEQHETTPESMVNATFSEWMASDYDNLNKHNAGAVNLQHKKQENAIEEKNWFDNPQGKAENTNGAMDEPPANEAK